MEEESMEDILESLYRNLGKEKKSSSPKVEEPDPTTILPQWSLPGKKVSKMKIEKRRRPGGGSGNIEPLGM